MARALQIGLGVFALLLHGACAAVAPSVAPPGMLLVAAGAYRPLFAAAEPQPVPAFWLDARPVTNGEFLEFVRTHPAWRRSRVSRALADTSYLAHWEADLKPGTRAPGDAPVTGVSWFAARAYAQAHGKRLPTQAEWERAAAAGPDRDGAGDDPEFLRRILRWYSQPSRLPLPLVRSTEANVFGVWDLHGLVWEWVSDFNTALVTGESRADAALERNLFCGSGALGASTFRDYAAFMRYAFRSSLRADYTVQNLGFRCAQDEEKP